MAHVSEVRLLVLHGLRLRGFGEAAAVADLTGLDVDDVTKHLEALNADGLVLHRDGRLPGWALTAAGRAEQERALAEEADAAGARPAVQDAYERFLGINTELLEVCTAWQMRGDALNDHSDAVYDSGVVARLEALHQQLGPILDDLERALVRYEGYRPRLEAALAKLREGDNDWFTKPMIDSYHTVWFQLHEDLLNTLGIDRSAEGST
jgi:hypothetical protein